MRKPLGHRVRKLVRVLADVTGGAQSAELAALLVVRPSGALAFLGAVADEAARVKDVEEVAEGSMALGHTGIARTP